MRRIAVVSEANPLAVIAQFELGPQAALAKGIHVFAWQILSECLCRGRNERRHALDRLRPQHCDPGRLRHMTINLSFGFGTRARKSR